jgi:hypothetical protein
LSRFNQKHDKQPQKSAATLATKNPETKHIHWGFKVSELHVSRPAYGVSATLLQQYFHESSGTGAASYD